MKSAQKITRVQLKLNQRDEFILLGVVSSEPDYKLSLSINQKFRISLKNTSPVRISENKGKELSFSRFTDNSRSPGIAYNLISNRSDKIYFLKNLKNGDYIFQIHDPENESNIDNLASSLREIESINAIFKIDLNTFKDKNLQFLIL
jgi:hypothetical protein